MKGSFYLQLNKIILIFISFLGFSTACDNVLPAVEYGVPHADFIVKGSIKSDNDNIAIKNIRVIMKDARAAYSSDTSYTDNNGNYLLKISSFPSDQSFSIDVQDIDGLTNGNFQPLDTTVNFVKPKFSGGDGHWNSGETEIDLNLKMKPRI